MSTRLEHLSSELFTRVDEEASAAVLGGVAVAGHYTVVAWDIIDGVAYPAYAWDPGEAATQPTTAPSSSDR